MGLSDRSAIMLYLPGEAASSRKTCKEHAICTGYSSDIVKRCRKQPFATFPGRFEQHEPQLLTFH